MEAMSGPRPVRSPIGTQLSCANWQIEAPYRMLQNNLDPDVAERPDDLVVRRHWQGSAQLGRVRRHVAHVATPETRRDHVGAIG